MAMTAMIYNDNGKLEDVVDMDVLTGRIARGLFKSIYREMEKRKIEAIPIEKLGLFLGDKKAWNEFLSTGGRK